MKKEYCLKPVKRISIAIFLFVLFITGCSKDSNLDTETLANLYTDVMIARELYSSQPDSMKANLDKLFEEYNTTEKDYNNAMKNMPASKDNWELFFRISEARLDSLRDK